MRGLVGLGVGNEGNAALSREGAYCWVIEIKVRWVDSDLAPLATTEAMAPQACNDGVNAGEHGSTGECMVAEEHV